MTDEHSREVDALVAVAAGAAIGGLAIFVLRTASGRRLLDTAINLLDDFSSECARFRQACTRAQLAVSDGWQAVKDTTMSDTGGGRETVF